MFSGRKTSDDHETGFEHSAQKKKSFKEHMSDAEKESDPRCDLYIRRNSRKELEELSRYDKKLWEQLRNGRLTSSKAFDMIVKCNYKAEKVFYGCKAMEWGRVCEEECQIKMETEFKQTIMSTGFMLHPQCIHVGASCDGLIKYCGKTYILEIKSPFSQRRQKDIVEMLRNYKYVDSVTGRLLHDNDYGYQVQLELACWDEAEGCIFIIYTPHFIITQLIERNERIQQSIKEGIKNFVSHKMGEEPMVIQEQTETETTEQLIEQLEVSEVDIEDCF